MAKDTFYFSHDYNARTDAKVKRLIAKHGMLGYGVFWGIVEDLYNNANALPTDYDSIAFDLRTDSEVVKSVVCDFDLFVFEDGHFGSVSIERRLEERNNKSVKARESALKRWSKCERNANAEPTHSEGNAIKESKGNKVKEKKLSERELLRLEIIRNLSNNGRTQEEIETLATSTAEEDFRQFSRLTEWIAEHTPNVADMKEPITLRQFVKIREEIKDKAKITELLKNMQNWKPLLQKNVSAYQTLLNWAKRENK